VAAVARRREAAVQPSSVGVATAQPSEAAVRRPAAVEPPPSAVAVEQRGQPVAAASPPAPREVAAHAEFQAATEVSARSQRPASTARRRWAAAQRPLVFWQRRGRPPAL